MAEAVPTILDLKLSFLRQQTLALSSPLSVPPTYAPSGENHALRQRSIDEALFQLNARIKEHAKLVYSMQAQRHVAEQVDALYWLAGERDVTGDVADGGLERGDDLALEQNIAKLPDQWEDERDGQATEGDVERYGEWTEYLKATSDRRKELREKIERYTALKDGLAPLQDVQQNVQQNLCTRDSEVEKELEKMRMLMARVRGRLGGLEERSVNDDEDVDMGFLDDHLKVEALLGTV